MNWAGREVKDLLENIISDLNSISESETYSHMKQAVLDLSDELKDMKERLVE